jgi:hypothetical protein
MTEESDGDLSDWLNVHSVYTNKDLAHEVFNVLDESITAVRLVEFDSDIAPDFLEKTRLGLQSHFVLIGHKNTLMQHCVNDPTSSYKEGFSYVEKPIKSNWYEDIALSGYVWAASKEEAVTKAYQWLEDYKRNNLESSEDETEAKSS